MTSKSHRIQCYNYAFDARAGGPGTLQLWDAQRRIADVKFVAEPSAVPAPVVAPDLASATLFARGSTLPGLIQALRTGNGLVVRLDDQGLVAIEDAYGLTDSRVVCASCAPELLAAKTQGILEAMRRLVAFCGADAPPEVCPVTFHLDDDSYCGPYQSGKTTGYFSCDASGLGHVCLYSMEHARENPPTPFTVETAATIQAQLLAVHEAMHAWFVGRQDNYRIQEPFCKFVSFVVSQAQGGPDYCSWFRTTPDTHPDVLMKYLCAIGMSAERIGQTLRQLAQSAAGLGRSLSDAEFAGLVTGVLGRDAMPAFRSAGILP